MSSSEAVLHADSNRFVLFPIRYPTLWQAYKDAQKSFWTTEEIDFSGDLSDWTNVLNDAERSLLSVILAFFASSDGIVAENLVHQFCAEVQAPEARCFYGFQIMMENVHAETYTRFLQELVMDETELRRLFGAVNTIPTVKRKVDWCLEWFDRTAYTFGTRLIAFAIVEGVFFSSSFAAIFWIRSRGLLPGLCHSNELIMRDEGQHMDFACRLYKVLDEVVPEVIVHEMISEAVSHEQAFFADTLPNGLRGLNANLMNQYVEYVADFLLWRLGYATMYGQTNPFPFMESTAIPARANFFERPVTDYQGAAGSIDADFDEM
ncbi:putative ribonucleoside-diphosphate reductase small chain B [Ganoderma leucocontextum]|nr:putative ribonucleoside-diphosphate reductase small chain B [Ganoderma leucocontextum]